MTTKWQWLMRQFARTLWVRASLYCVLAVATALLAIAIEPVIPKGIAGVVGADAVDHVLDILASSMLAVTTFSLTVMVSAYAAATSNVTPRATRLLMQDTTTQNVLSTFLGSFLFSLVGIIALSTGAYGESGRLVLFVVTLGIITVVVVALLRWISHLTHFGRVGDTTARVEDATCCALGERVRKPFLGGCALASDDAVPTGARPVTAARIGYVQHIDMAELERAACRHGVQLYLAVLPGSFVHLETVIVRVSGELSDELRDCVLAAISVGDERSFDQDPRFGLCVLAEIASRALSPAVNDPGTALDVLGRAVRILSCWTPATQAPTEVDFPSVHVPSLSIDDLLADVFGPIARDGASLIEVQIRLQKSLLALAEMDPSRFVRAAREQSHRAVGLAVQALALEADRDTVRMLSRRLDTLG